MNLYLIRHGEAKSPEEDHYRGLTSRGEKEIRETAAWLGSQAHRIDAIWHSPKLRAAQTAEILQEVLSLPPGIMREVPNLLPHSPARDILRVLEKTDLHLAIVGHMPFMAILATLLLTGQDFPPVSAFHTAGIMHLCRKGTFWEEKWYIAPGMAPPQISSSGS